MYFRRIRIENLHSHADTTLDMQRLTFIRGANGVGKSSVEQAIQITLAGRAEATTSDGKGVADYIRAGAQKALVTLAVADSDGERILKCALTGDRKPAIVVTKPSDPQYAGSSDYLDYLAMNREVLSCLTNNRYFVGLPEKDQKNILAAIILPKSHQWEEWVVPAANQAGLRVNWSKTPFEVIAEAHKAAFDARTNVNRDIKNFRMPEGEVVEARNFERYSLDHAKAREAHQAAQKRKFEAEGESRGKLALVEAAKGRLSQAQARLEREQAVLTANEALILSPAKLKDAEKTSKNATKAEQLEKEVIRLDSEIAVLKASMKKLNALSEEPCCPTCMEPLIAKRIGLIAKPIADSINRLCDERTTSIDARKALGNPTEAQKQIDEHNRAKDEVAKAKARIKDEQTVIADAEAAINAYSTISVDTRELDAEIASAAKLVDEAAELVAKARAAKDLVTRREAADKERTDLTRRQVTLEKLVAYFGCDGVKAELLSKAIEPFALEMNKVLGNWGYTCRLSIEPYAFTVVFATSDGGTFEVPLSHLSKSQRYRFAVAFQVALAIVTGFRFVIVDEFDIYDADGKAGLFEALDAGELDQAIIIGTDERTAVPELDGAVFYLLTDSAGPGMIPATVARKLTPTKERAA